MKRMFATVECVALLVFTAAPSGVASVVASPRGAVTHQKASKRRRRGATGVKMSKRTKIEPEIGIWGGAHVRLNLREDGGSLEFDCAQGEIGEPLALDAEGHFDLSGTYTREGAGPIRINHPPVARPALYVGRVEGRTMSLSVKFTDAAQTLDNFTLTRGSEGRLWKCR